MTDIQTPTAEEVQQVVNENNQVLNWIETWQAKNDYTPKFLDEYNAKFKAEFNDYLDTSNLSESTIKLFKD